MRGPRDRGSATAELAAGLPVLVLLLCAALTAVTAVIAQLACVDAAAEAARAQARGEAGVPAGRRSAPPGATVTVTDGDPVRARVLVVVRPLGRLLPTITVSADAVAAREPS